MFSLDEVCPAKLLGRPLPKLDGIRISLSAAQTEKKAILLCFFDANQRPSRHCITQLAKKASELKEKGITVVVVQAAQIEENTLKEWINKSDIPFPVSIIAAGIEKAPFTWGVRSLPWLILTDRRHIVTAEGFGLDELDAQIGRSNESQSRRP